MGESAKLFLGDTMERVFIANGCGVEGAQAYSLRSQETFDTVPSRLIEITVSAEGFLRYMVAVD